MTLMETSSPALALAPDPADAQAIRRVVVIFNPASGRRRRHRLEAVLRRLADADCLVELRQTTRRGDAERIARATTLAHCDRLVVAGGDGTINEAINGVQDSRLSLAIVPLGTANVLAAEIGLSTDPDMVARTILHGEPRAVSLGVVNGRKFGMMAGVGFDAQAVTRVDLAFKRRFGKLAYIRAGLEQLRVQQPTMYDIEIDGRMYRAASAIVAKGHFYAGRYVCAPAARLDDPQFQVCLFMRPGRWNVLRYAAALGGNFLDSLDDVKVIPARHVRVLGPAGEPVQSDGDIIARLPVEMSIVERGLTLAMPSPRMS
jgi:diacylglycerol kinase (ATP)